MMRSGRSVIVSDFIVSASAFHFSGRLVGEECVAPDFCAKSVKREAFSLEIAPFSMVRRTVGKFSDSLLRTVRRRQSRGQRGSFSLEIISDYKNVPKVAACD
jgi:hypothetical protein